MKTMQRVIGGVVAILFFTSNFYTRAQTAAPDSIVQIAAEAKGLSLAAPETLPLHGTFWLANNEGSFLLPLPWLPDVSTNAPIFSLGDGQFLIDDTGGTLPQPTWRQAQRGITVSNMVERQGSAVLDLIDQVQEAQFEAEMQEMFPEMYSMDSEEQGGGESMMSLVTFPDPGLRILVPTNALATAGQFAVILTNTIPDEPYDVLTKSDLNGSAWSVEVAGIYTTTNFIPVQLSRNGRTNLFVWARYAGDSTGSGMPDWWLLTYFGTTDIDPYADPDNDGWNNLQEYQNGTNPTQFNTPPPPRNVTATLSGTNVSFTWESGGVTPTQYGIIKNGTELTQIGGTNLAYSSVPYLVNDYYAPYGTAEPTFQIRAYYSSGYAQSSAVTVAKPALTLNGAALVRGSQGQMSLSVASPPPGLSFIRFYWTSFSANLWFDVSTTNLVNGILPIPKNSFPSSNLVYYLPLSAKAFSTNGTFGLGTYTPLFTDDEFDELGDDGFFSFVDARRQMKENLIFLLRTASASRPFRYGSESWTWGVPYEWIDVSFKDYAFYGFHMFHAFDGFAGNYSPIDEIRPVYEHFLWRNFVFNTVDVTNFNFKTGVRQSGFSDNNGDWQPYFMFYPQPKYEYTGTGAESPLPLLFTNAASTWLEFSDDFWSDPDLMPDLGISGSSTNLAFAANTRNFYGLPINSLHFYDHNNQATTMTGGQSGANIQNGVYLNKLFVEIAQPQLSAVSYYFVNQTYYFNNYQYSDFPSTVGPAIPMPGSPSFASTNISPLIIAGIGQPISVSGWAKMAIANGYSDRFAYLEQYFDKAYIIGTNGVATTNNAGILSPYGEFLPTQPGPAALVTMPDLDTGQRGTGVVQVVKLQLDVNHDGAMNLSFMGPDNTSQANPMRFWVNSDNDGEGIGADKEGFTHKDSDYGKIRSQRNLEDFARLWVCGLPKLPTTSGYTITLSLFPSSGSPAINLYAQNETNGNAAYLTDTNVAAGQFTQQFLNNQLVFDYSQKVGSLSDGVNYTLPVFSDGTPQFIHFLFEGVGIGAGQLVLTIQQGTNTIIQTSAFIDLRSVNNFIDHARASDVSVNDPPTTNAGIFTIDSPATVSDTAEDKQIVVFVHGINNTPWEYENTSQTMFKRLYWQGYRGRFAAFRWPSPIFTGIPTSTNEISYFNFNKGEYVAFQSGAALKSYIANLRGRFPGYTLNLAAHSLGNAVANEAIRLGAQVDNYAMMQAAMSAWAFDGGNTNLIYSLLSAGAGVTPNLNALGGYNNCFTNAARRVNFYNDNDYALFAGPFGAWEGNQFLSKPDSFTYLGGFTYRYSFDGTNCFYREYDDQGQQLLARTLAQDYEKKSFVARSRTKAVGAAGLENPPYALTGGSVVANVGLRDSNLGFVGGAKFSDTRPEHSGEFTKNIQNTGPFYEQLLQTGFQINQNP